MEIEKKENVKMFLYVVFPVAVFLGLFMYWVLIITNPYMAFWLTQEQKEWGWCRTQKPEFNVTPFDAGYGAINLGYSKRNDERNQLCYTKYWKHYCKMRQPEDCPI